MTFATNSARALLAYLAVESDRPRTREGVAALLWPDQPQAAAYANLRQTLARVRKALPDPSLAGLIQASQQTLQFDGAAAEIDVLQFEACLRETETHAHADLVQCSNCVERLQQAVALYNGEFLHGLFMDHSQPFGEWLLFRREQLHRQVLTALHVLASAAELTGDFGQMQQYAARQVALEPWREEAHAQIMRALAHSGDRTGALAQYETCCRILDNELGMPPSPETQSLYEHIRDRTFATDRVAAPPAYIVPTPLTPFVDRGRELAEITARLGQPEVRLLTLVGAGGMGKTRLALELARTQLDAFEDGVFFVSLAPLLRGDAIIPAIAQTLGLHVQGDPAHALLQAVRSKHLLLVLDNFEHVLDGSSVVIDLLQAAPRLHVLATSREQLGVRGEHVYSVGGMEYTPNAALDAALATPAVRLFVQCAHRVRPSFQVSAATMPFVQRICRLVDGTPLGLELAAGWTEMLSLDEIAAEIEKSADFLATEWRDAPERQRSMRAVFDWSWQLLSDDERQVFRQLSVFRGGFTREAAQTVTGASLRVLTRLLHKSLLHWGEGYGTSRRYTIHELLRQFAAEHLDAVPNERAAVEARHSTYYLRFAAEREMRMARSDPHLAAAEITREIDNVRQAWTWAAVHACTHDLDRSAYSLWLYFMHVGLYAVADQMFTLVVDHLLPLLDHAAQDTGSNVRRWQGVVSKLLALRAFTLTSHSEHDRALDVAQQAIRLGEGGVSIEGEALGYLSAGRILNRKSQFLAARPYLNQAKHISRLQMQSGGSLELFHDVEWIAYLYLGAGAMMLGDYAGARQHLQQALAICQRLGMVRGEITCLLNLADIDRDVGDYEAAWNGYGAGLRIAGQVGYRWGEGTAELELGNIARCRGEYSLANDMFEHALLVFQEISDPLKKAITLYRLARLHSYVGAYTAAQTQIDQFQHLIRTIKSPDAEAEGVLSCAVLAIHQGNYEQALVYAQQSWKICREIDNLAGETDALITKGHAQAALQRLPEAARSYQQSLAICEKTGRAPMAAEARAGLASVALTMNDPAAALAHVEVVWPMLVSNTVVGLDEPFYVYLACYQVLHTLGDPRAASVLHSARSLLHQYADHITDSERRRSFLEDVAIHRDIMCAANRDLLPIGGWIPRPGSTELQPHYL